jgi:transposase-like protein
MIWHLDEVVITIAGQKHWLWRAVDQDGYVLDEIVQTRRDTNAAKRLLKRLLKKQGCPPRRMISDKLGSYATASGAKLLSDRAKPPETLMRLGERWPKHASIGVAWSKECYGVSPRTESRLRVKM